jgi:hypothetical protein
VEGYEGVAALEGEEALPFDPTLVLMGGGCIFYYITFRCSSISRECH